jgi:hypothetical protein
MRSPGAIARLDPTSGMPDFGIKLSKSETLRPEVRLAVARIVSLNLQITLASARSPGQARR